MTQSEIQKEADIAMAELLADVFQKTENQRIRMTAENPKSDEAKVAKALTNNIFILTMNAKRHAGLAV